MSRERDISLSEAVLSDTSTYVRASYEQYRGERERLEDSIRTVLGPRLEKSLLSQLLPKFESVPTYYQLVKTHKLPRETNGYDNSAIKTRPIVSSCGGPTDRISWFLHHLLSPLLSYVPAHLRNVQQFLEQLSSATSTDDNDWITKVLTWLHCTRMLIQEEQLMPVCVFYKNNSRIFSFLGYPEMTLRSYFEVWSM